MTKPLDPDEIPEISGYRTPRMVPASLERQASTPRTRQVKNLVLNANKGYHNPLNNHQFQAADEFTKQKEYERKAEGNTRQPKPVYLYKQVHNGVNIRLAKPVKVKVSEGHVVAKAHIERGQVKKRVPIDQIEARKKNHKDFLHYVQESKDKKKIKQMKAYINNLEDQIKKFDPDQDVIEEPIQQERPGTG